MDKLWIFILIFIIYKFWGGIYKIVKFLLMLAIILWIIKNITG